MVFGYFPVRPLQIDAAAATWPTTAAIAEEEARGEPRKIAPESAFGYLLKNFKENVFRLIPVYFI